MAIDPDRTIGPSGICRMDMHEWRHDPPGGQRRVCVHCGGIAQAAPCPCPECRPQREESGSRR